MHLLDLILNFAGRHPAPVYTAVFLVALAESLGLAGLLVPGSILLFLFATLAGTGQLGLMPVFLLALAGAVAADCYNYWLGARYHRQFRTPRLFSRHPQILHKADAFLLRHGSKSIICARFAGLIHPVITMRAGMKAMSPDIFLGASLISASAWVGTHILAGILFGIFLTIATAVSARLSLLLLLLVLILWSFFWLCRRILFVGLVFAKKWMTDLRLWAQARPSSHGLIRLVQRFVATIFSLVRRAELPAVFLGIILLAAGSGFAAVVQDVLAKDSLVLVDQSVYHFIQGLRTHWSDSFFVAITELGDSFVTTTLVIVLLLLFLALRLWRTALFWLLNAVGGSIGMQVLKWTFQQPRPTNLYEGISSYSFPSGHTTMSVVIYGFLAIILARNLAGIRQWLLFSTILLIAFFIGFSRIYLGAHWFSDVLAGSLIGTSWAALLGIVWLRGKTERIPRIVAPIIVVAVLASAGLWHVTQRHEHDMQLYAPRLIEKNLDLAAWYNNGWQHLPAARLDLGAVPEQPMTLQWAAEPEEIRQILTQGGWLEPPTPGPANLFSLFRSHTPVGQLPLLPRLHEGKRESLLLVQNYPDSRLVLRLWAEAITLSPTDTPLFTGFIEEQHSSKLGRLRSFPVDSGNYAKGQHMLAKELRGEVMLQEATRSRESSTNYQDKSLTERQDRILLVWPKK